MGHRAASDAGGAGVKSAMRLAAAANVFAGSQDARATAENALCGLHPAVATAENAPWNFHALIPAAGRPPWNFEDAFTAPETDLGISTTLLGRLQATFSSRRQKAKAASRRAESGP